MFMSKFGYPSVVTILLALSLNAQTFLNENWSGASGVTPPPGWTKSQSGASPAQWRWDNPGARAFAAPFSGLFAICDADNPGSTTAGNSILTSPTFNATGTTLLNLAFDLQFRALQTTGDFAQVEVFDGSVWNVITNYTTTVGYLLPSANTTVPATFDVTAAAGGSASAQLRFNYNYGWDWWWAVDNVSIIQPVALDIGVQAISAPTNDTFACLPLTGSQTVTATLVNGGASAITAGTFVQMDYSVNGGPATTEFLTLAAPLNAGATTTYTFTAPALFPTPGPNTLGVTAILVGDLDPLNDTKSQTYTGAGPGAMQAIPYTQNFDSAPAQNSVVVPAGWVQDLADATGTDSDWYMHTGTTTTANTGPIADHTTGLGYYAYVEDAANFAQVNLLSPCFDFSLAVNPTLQFWMHSFNGTVPATSLQNFLSVDVFAYPGGAVTLDVFGPVGHQATSANWSTSQWTQQNVNLAAFSGQILRFRFRGRSNGGGAAHDIAIDDVKVFDLQPTPGQMPRPGLAAFDINGALNVNAQNVASGAGGPYFAGVTQGTNFTMSFNGHPTQPIAVVYGSLNPVSATYPGGIGQFDIGGPGVDPNGIPLNLGVLVNAIAWAQGGFQGLPIDAMFFTTSTGLMSISLPFPNFGIPSGNVITTFQAAITAPAAPFVYISNAIQIKTN